MTVSVRVPPTPFANEGMTMTALSPRVTAGVDTHLDVHVTAALDARGALLDVASPMLTRHYPENQVPASLISV